MNRILVWDIPTRIFHWVFAGSLVAAMALGLLADEDHPLFRVHMLFGIVAVFMLLIRLVMGLVGSRYARFSSYPVNPREVARYMVDAVTSKTKLFAGNNPGSAVAASMMFLLVAALFVTGIGFGGEDAGELHGALAWALVAVVALHIAGLAWHTIRHRENISLAMVTGRKAGIPENAIRSSHPLWGGVMLVVSGLWIAALFGGYNDRTGAVKIPLTGVTLQLGEQESEHGERGEEYDDD